MRNVAIILIIAGFLNGCFRPNNCCTQQFASNLLYRQKVIPTTKYTYAAKDPRNVTIYLSNKQVLTPYRVIGIANISKYNLLGKKRPKKALDEMLKNMAASLGGDALINISSKGNTIQGHIIQFQRIYF